MVTAKHFMLIAIIAIGIQAQEDNEVTRQALCSELKVLGVCAKQVKADCISAGTISADQICTKTLVARDACIQRLSTAQLCTNEVDIQRICAEDINTDSLCAQSATLNEACIIHERAELICADEIKTTSICVSGLFQQCLFLTSRMAVSSSYTYTLGDTVTFDTIQSDPSGSLAQNPSRFITPESGLYALTVQLITENLSGSEIIAGAPIGDVEVWVGGFLRRQLFVPYLAFNHSQSNILTTLISLTQGQEVLVRYKVLVLDANVGLVEFVGHVTMIGAPGFANNSTFIMHYLGSECPIAACTPCTISCEPCLPCSPLPPCPPLCQFTECAPCENIEPCIDPCSQ